MSIFSEIENVTDATQVPLITPELAKLWLATRNTKNRTVSRHTVEKYAADMKNGNWHLNGDPIGFDADGNLANGQHRLHAIVLAGVPVRNAIAANVVPLGIDMGRKRSFADVLRISDNIDWLGSNEIATARQMIAFSIGNVYHGRHQSYDSIRDFCLAHEDAIKFAHSHINRSGQTTGVAHAITRGVIACAYYYVDHDVLARFCEVLVKGMTDDPCEISAIKLRDKLLQKGRENGADRRNRHGLMVSRAIELFAAKTPVSSLHAASEFRFALKEFTNV